jgi:shikimate dehydrogenase
MKKKSAKKVYTLADLQSWTEASREVDPPIRLGVFGDPVAHSLSPEIQNAALKACQIDIQFARFHIRPEELGSAIALLSKLDFVGANLTVPHKIAALGFVDELDDEAKQIGAVNTIAVRDGKLIGFNTDGVGFTRAIRNEFSVDLRDLRSRYCDAMRAVKLRTFGDREPQFRQGETTGCRATSPLCRATCAGSSRAT